MAVSQSWNAAQYAQQGRFVADLAGGVLDLLAPRPGERILDLGCGDGALTAKIVASGAEVLGVDSSPSMVEAAQALGLTAQLINGEALPFDAEFDAVFSNAALHWVRNQRREGWRRRSLSRTQAWWPLRRRDGWPRKHRGNTGGAGRCAPPVGARCIHHGQQFFPSDTQYRSRLEAAGFAVDQISLIPRPTKLPESGIVDGSRPFVAASSTNCPPSDGSKPSRRPSHC